MLYIISLKFTHFTAKSLYSLASIFPFLLPSVPTINHSSLCSYESTSLLSASRFYEIPRISETIHYLSFSNLFPLA